MRKNHDTCSAESGIDCFVKGITGIINIPHSNLGKSKIQVSINCDLATFYKKLESVVDPHLVKQHEEEIEELLEQVEQLEDEIMNLE